MPKRIDTQKPYTPPPAFKTMAEVHAYLAQDPLPCLLCGKEFRGLEAHLKHRHEIRVVDYQMMFGIPRTMKPIAPSLKREFSDRARKLREAGILWQGRPDHHPNCSPDYVRPFVPQVEATRRLASEVRIGRKRPKTWLAHHYIEYLNRVQQGRSIDSVGLDQDMPSRASFYMYLKSSRGFKKRFHEVMDQLPFDQQLRSHYVSDELKEAVIDLHAQGCDAKEIAWHLEITLRSAITLLRKLQLTPQAESKKIQAAL